MKPNWGSENFMVVNKTPVYNSANLAMFIVKVSQALMRPPTNADPTTALLPNNGWLQSSHLA
jgi:hypothetical protein